MPKGLDAGDMGGPGSLNAFDGRNADTCERRYGPATQAAAFSESLQTDAQRAVAVQASARDFQTKSGRNDDQALDVATTGFNRPDGIPVKPRLCRESHLCQPGILPGHLQGMSEALSLHAIPGHFGRCDTRFCTRFLASLALYF